MASPTYLRWLLLLFSVAGVICQEFDVTEMSALEEMNITTDRTQGTVTEMMEEMLATTNTTEALNVTEEVWVNPFPPDDPLNHPWFGEMKYKFPTNKTELDGLRNAMAFATFNSIPYLGNILYFMGMDPELSAEMATDPYRNKKLYCLIQFYPLLRQLFCHRGDNRYFNVIGFAEPWTLFNENLGMSITNMVIAVLNFILGIIGNIIILLAIATTKELKNSTNILLAGIAVVDLLNSALIVGYRYPYSIWLLAINKAFGPMGCQIGTTLSEMFTYVSVNHLIVLSFERYFTICWPMKSNLKFTTKKSIMIIIMMWIIGIIEVLPYALITSAKQPTYKGARCNDSIVAYDYNIHSLLLYVIIPVIIMAVNYTNVVRSLIMSIRKKRQMTGDRSQTQDDKARLRVVYMLITLVVFALVFLLPGRIARILGKAGYLESVWNDFRKIYTLLDLMRSLNSCSNFVTYTIMSRQFREAFVNVIRCKCGKPLSKGRKTKAAVSRTSTAK